MRTHNIPSCYRNQREPHYASWPGAVINPHWLELPLSRTNLNGPKGVRAIEVRLYTCTVITLPFIIQRTLLITSVFVTKDFVVKSNLLL